MKKTVYLINIISFMAVIVFLMAGCKEEGGTITSDPNLAGTITIDPSGPVVIGTTLTAVYNGTETVSYQWNRNREAINGAANETYTPTQDGDYTVTVSASGYNSKTSAAVTVVLYDLTGTVTITPNTGVYVGMALTAVYSGTETIDSYQWNKEGIAINGATLSAYFPTQAGNYTVTVSAENYNSISSGSVSVINGLNLNGAITISPNSPVLINTMLTGIYTGTENVIITLQWNRNGIPISGATNATYTPTLVGDYTITAGAAGYNGKTSAPVTVVFPDLSGNLTITPNTDVTPGTTLTANYDGSETVSYQWNRNGEAISGATGNTYTPSQIGNYTVTVSAASYTSKTSDPVNVLFILSGNVTITPNTDVFVGRQLTATYSGSETVGYQWNRDGTPISGAASRQYAPTQAGSYTVTVSRENNHSKTSTAVRVDSGTINVTFTGPTEKVIQITRNITNNLSQSGGGSITLTVNEDFDRYEWFIGETKVTTGKEVTLYANNAAFTAGYNWITVAAYLGNVPYSGVFVIKVNN